MALQEFLASYAVQVDEDGARRLQAVLEENRSAGQELAAVFEAARSALAGLKKELSDASGLQGVLTALRLGAAGGSGLPGNSRLPVVSGASSVSGSYRYTPSTLAGFSGLSAGSSLLSVGADFSAAEEALAAFRSRMESERPRLSVNTSGITSAVSGAVSSIRSMLSSVRVSVPVTAMPKLDLSGMNSGGGNPGGSSGGSTGGSSVAVPTISAAHYGSGGRVASPTLAVIAEEGRPEYVIPTDNESRASSLLRGLLSEVSDSVRNTLVSDLLASVRSSFVPDPNLSGPESGSDGRISGSVPSSFGLSGTNLSGNDLSGFSLSGSGLSASGLSGSDRPYPEPSDAGRSGLRPADSGLSGFDLSEAASSLLGSVLSGSDSGNSGSVDSVSGLSDLLPSVSALSAAARESFLPAGSSGGTTVQTVQAPVNIHVTAAAASPEAVARSVYDLSQRSLLKTLKGVFAG